MLILTKSINDFCQNRIFFLFHKNVTLSKGRRISLGIAKIQSIILVLYSTQKNSNVNCMYEELLQEQVMYLSSFQRKMAKNKITFEFQPPFQKFPIFSALKVFKKAGNFKTWDFFFKIHLVEIELFKKQVPNYFFHTCIIYVCSMQRKNLSI